MAAWVFWFEPRLVIPCSLALLLYPNPLVVLAAILGAVPSVARILLTGRPWRRTAFDVPLAMLVVGAWLGVSAGLYPEGVAQRLYGLLAGLILFAAIREHGSTPARLRGIAIVLLALTTMVSLVLVNVVGPYLRLDRVPPLAAFAAALEPLGIVQPLLADEGVLQRYRLYASGVGALAVVGLGLVFGILVGTRRWRDRLALLGLSLFFGLLLLVSDNRGSILAAAITLGLVAGFWRPQLLILAPLAVLVAVNLVGLGVAQRGLNARTLFERLWFWQNGLYLAQEVPFTGAGLGVRSVMLTYRGYFDPAFHPFTHMHSIYVQALLEQGLLGLIGMISLLLATLWLCWQARAHGDRSIRAVRLAGLGVALALFSTGLTEIHALTTFGGALLFIGLGLVAATTSTDGERRAWRVRWSWRARLAAVALVVAATFLLLVPVGLAVRGASLALLNIGTVELNRATLAEDVDRTARSVSRERALRLLQRAADLDGANPTVHRNLALVLAAGGDESGARGAADRARAVTAPLDRRAQFQLGRAYVAAHAWPEAIAAWDVADAGESLVRLGDRLLRMEDLDLSMTAYTTAALAHPDIDEAREGMAHVARERGATVEQVVSTFDPLVARGGLSEYFARIQIARTYRESGRPADALESLRLAELVTQGDELASERAKILANDGQ